jgi:dihydropteroate synthase
LTRRSETFEQMLLLARRKRGIALMGVCNVTTDSFSDGGAHFTFKAACERVDTLVLEGADLVDIGAESTRPGARRVSAADQLARVLDVVRYAAKKTCASVDTTSPDVAEACLEAGAIALNDVSCLADTRLAKVVQEAGATLILMHARGSQAEMPGFSVYPEDGYGDVVEDVLAEWSAAADRATSMGLDRRALVMDPGLGFAKNARQSLELLRRTSDLVTRLDVPVLVGASRKSFLRIVDPDASATERMGASIAAATMAMRAGASLVRVHDVRATRQAIDLTRTLGGAP